MSDARCQLAQRAQFVGPRGAFPLLLLFSDIVSNTKNAGRLIVDDDRRAVDGGKVDRAIVCQIARFEALRRAGQGGSKLLASHIAVFFVYALEKTVADDLAGREAGHVEHGLVTPFIATVGIEGVDSFARALHDVLEQ